MSSGFQPSAHADANDYNSLIHTPATAAASPSFVVKRLLASLAVLVLQPLLDRHFDVEVPPTGFLHLPWYPVTPSPLHARARSPGARNSRNLQKHFQLESRSVRERSPQTCSAESIARILVSLMQHRPGEQS